MNELSRRSFLTLTASAVAMSTPSIGLQPACSLPSSAVVRESASRRQLSIHTGYCALPDSVARVNALMRHLAVRPGNAGHFDTPNADELPPFAPEFTFAENFSTGDPNFASKGVEFTIFGMHLPGQSAIPLKSAGVNIIVPISSTPDSDSYEVHAWNYSNCGVPHVSHAHCSKWGLGGNRIFELEMAIAYDVMFEDMGVEPTRLTAVFPLTIGTETELPKLRRGIYLFAIAPECSMSVWPPMNWKRTESDCWRLTGAWHTSCPDFAYILAGIDYAHDVENTRSTHYARQSLYR
jgi:hypothetical protein